jgi:hypothetical protein
MHQRVTWGVRRLNPMVSWNPGNAGEIGNLVVEIDVKENVEEGPMMANTELLEACISSGKANSVSGRAN